MAAIARQNISDDDQYKMETSKDHSAIRFHWFNGRSGVGETKAIRAYDLQAQGDGAGAPSTAVEKVAASVIGSYSDNAAKFQGDLIGR